MTCVRVDIIIVATLTVLMGATATIPWSAPAFMAPVVERVRRESGLPVAIAWGVGPPEIADNAVRNGQADLVKVGRALLASPHWPYTAAVALGVERSSWATLPAPYAFWLEQYEPVTAVAPVEALSAAGE
ncbi:MAG: xenA [Caballeronia mineralivorans]|jgi:2,4-dienoyl-CoA reductase-like NADH-dependent reductase (Old Yellow Enzyme family)|nr:xenA [Caballeronia mineralivorans]